MKIFKKLLFSFIYPSGDQDVNPGCDSFSALLGSKVIISSDCYLSSSLISSGSSWRPCSRWGSCSLPLPSTGSGCCNNTLYVMNSFVYRVVLFLFPFIHAIGQVIFIIRTLPHNCVFFSEPSDLCCNEQVVQELFIQNDERVVLQDREPDEHHHKHRL